MAFSRPQQYEEQIRMTSIIKLEERLKGIYTQLVDIQTKAAEVKAEVDADVDSTADMITAATQAANYTTGGTYQSFVDSLLANVIS